MERKNKNFVKVIALCLPLLLGACGTKKVVDITIRQLCLQLSRLTF